jgi:hypothetical protein
VEGRGQKAEGRGGTEEGGEWVGQRAGVEGGGWRVESRGRD